MSGINLREMEASDMLDVLHFLFEDDVNHSTAEQSEAQDKTRKSLYKELYGTNYAYQRSGKGGKTYINSDVVDEPLDADPVDNVVAKPFDPRANKPKPFIQPTKINPDSIDPFGGILDAPIK